MDVPPPSYEETVGPPTPIIITFYCFSYVRILQSKGRRIGRLLEKRKDVVLLSPNLTNMDFALPQVQRAGELFGWDDFDRVAFTMILRTQGRKDVVVDDTNWEAVCNFLTTPGAGHTSAKLIVAVGPVVKVSMGQMLGGVLLEAKRKLVGWSLPKILA